MRKFFASYYQRTDQETGEQWRDCIFAFDTSVLINIHNYSEEAQQRFFDILRQLQSQIWMPHQVGLEYHRKRAEYLAKQHKHLDDAVAALTGALSKIDNEQVKEQLKQADQTIRDAQANLPRLISDNPVTEALNNVFGEQIGKVYSNDALAKIYTEGAERFERSVPPGFMDKKDKPVPDRYGDLVIWFQLIDYAEEKKKPIIFITDEKKPDWWLSNTRDGVHPHPELGQEMMSKANVGFFMYNTERFLALAETFLRLPEQPDVIDEAREVSEQAETERYIKEFIEPESLEASIFEYDKVSALLERLRNQLQHSPTAPSAAYQAAQQRAHAIEGLSMREIQGLTPSFLERAMGINDALERHRRQDEEWQARARRAMEGLRPDPVSESVQAMLRRDAEDRAQLERKLGLLDNTLTKQQELLERLTRGFTPPPIEDPTQPAKKRPAKKPPELNDSSAEEKGDE